MDTQRLVTYVFAAALAALVVRHLITGQPVDNALLIAVTTPLAAVVTARTITSALQASRDHDDPTPDGGSTP